MVLILQRFSRIVLGYGVVQWFGPLISLIFTPIITRALVPSEYGTADFVLTVSSAINTMALLAIPQAIQVHYNDSTNAQWRSTLVGSALVVPLILAISLGALLYWGSDALAAYLLKNTEYGLLFQIVALTQMFSVVVGVLAAAAQAALRVRWGMAIGLTNAVVTVFGNVLFIVLLQWGVIGMISTPLAVAVSTAVLAGVLTRSLVGRPAFPQVKMLFRSGILLWPTAAAGWILLVADRFFLVQVVSMAELGDYAIANRVAVLLSVAMTPLYSAWTPLALSMGTDLVSKQRYMIMARYLVSAALFGALGLGLFAREILWILTPPSYQSAAPYVGFLTYMHVFPAIGATLFIDAMAEKGLGSLSTSVLTGAILNVILNVLLIPSLGVWGAVAATVFGYGASTLTLYTMTRKRLRVAYPMQTILIALMLQFVLLCIGLLAWSLPFPWQFIFKVGLLGVMLIGLLRIGMVTDYEFARLQELGRSLIHRNK